MKRLCSILLVLMLFFMTGCTTELYQQMLVKGFGIDLFEDGYKITVRYAALNQSDKEEQSVVTGSTVYQALNNLSLITGKRQMFSSAGYVVYSKAVAQQGLDKALDFFVRYFKSGPTINLYVAAGTAAEILEMKKDDKLISSEVIKAFTENAENKGKTISATALSFISDVKREGSDALIPLMEKTEDGLRCTRSAVFRDYAMVGQLSESETQGYLAGRGLLKNNSVVVMDQQGGKVTVKLTKTTAQTSCSMEGGTPSFGVQVKADAVLSSFYLSHKKADFAWIEQEIAKSIRADLALSLNACKETGSDFHSFGYRLYTDETAYWKQAKEKWHKSLEQLPLIVKVNATIISIGEEDTPQNGNRYA